MHKSVTTNKIGKKEAYIGLMELQFVKMNGIGNDFVVIDARTTPVDLTDQAR